MTTETRQDTRRTGMTILLRASLGAVLVGVLLSAVAAVVSGTPGLLAAALGAVVVVAVLFSGSLIVTVVADLMPSASLLVALMTYTLQIGLVGLLLIPLSTTAWAAEHLEEGWLAASVIAGALVWTVAQVVLTTRARIPIYDLPAPGVDHDSHAAAPTAADGGAR